MVNKSELIKIAEQYNTPGFVFDIDVLNERIDRIEEILGCGVTACFAMKANPFLVNPLKKRLDKFEVCSPGEFAICEKEEVDRAKIVLSGVNKEKDDIMSVMKSGGVGIYTIESMNQLKLINACANECRVKANVLIRVTSGNQFGINESDIYRIVENRDEYEGIHIEGIQLYSGTQKKKMSQIEDEIIWLKSIAIRCEAEYGLRLSEIEYGPGLSVDYFVNDHCDAMNDDYSDLCELAQILKSEKLTSDYKITLEIGRYIAATCGVMLTRIVDMKMNGTQRYAIIDSGINHINYYGQVMAMKTPRIEVVEGEQDLRIEPYAQGEQPFNICGSLCTVGDVLVKNLMLTDARVGDMLVFYNLGAYSVTEGINLFLSRRMPSVIMYSDRTGFKRVRKPIETWEINS